MIKLRQSLLIVDFALFILLIWYRIEMPKSQEGNKYV